MRRLLLAALLLLVVGAALLYAPDLDRATLVARYAPPPDTFRSVAGVQLHLRERGPADAPAVVLLHGFGSSLHTWDAWLTPLAERRRVIALDLPGAGLTGPDLDRDYSDGRSVAILAALLDSLRIPRATFIGNSLGGRLAWRFAAAHPERTDRLVLVSPDGFASEGFEYGVAPKVPLTAEAMRVVLPKPIVRASLAPAYADRTKLQDATVTRYYELLRAPGVRVALLDRLRQAILTPPEPMLRTITAPTLLLWGTQDSLIPIANAQDYLRAMSDVRLVTLPGVGHLPMEEAPEASLREVLAFLDAPDSTASAASGCQPSARMSRGSESGCRPPS